MTHINLLPLEFRYRLLVKTRLGQWLVVWGLGLAVIVGLYAAKSRNLQAQTRRLQTFRQACEPLRRRNAQNEQIRQRLAELRGRQSLLVELDEAQYPLLLVGIVSRGTHSTQSRVQVRDFSIAPIPQADAKSAQAANQVKKNINQKQQHQPQDKLPVQMRLTLKGIAVDDLAVARFVLALRDAGVFDSVKLISSRTTQLAGGQARQYLVECIY